MEKFFCETSTDVGRFLARTVDTDLYGGDNNIDRTQVDSWISFAVGPLSVVKSWPTSIEFLDKALVTKTWLVSKRLTLADIFVFSTLRGLFYTPAHFQNYCNVNRWFNEMSSLPSVQKYSSLLKKPSQAVSASSKIAKASKEIPSPEGRKQEGKFIELPGAEEGKVVVRFPPEASGFLHIGHAKAALLNAYYAETFKGQLIMRFDDTNPAKETVEFEQAILEDLRLLEVKADRFTHSSDYFELMLTYCEKLIKEGKAFVDDTPGETMKELREKRLPSTNRDNPVDKNLELWKEMQKGSKRGQECCVRAKIDYESANGCMRDPTIYRCKPEPHPRTGTKYKVYPTYDFACPIVDAVENVTHTLRTTEYHDRDDQFFWFIEALGLRKPHVWAYSRLNMTNTVLSKRKLTWFVDQGLVDGWDDPRFPTVRGILRRGMTVEGLKQFIISQGSSRSVVFMEWDKIWSINKKVVDPVAVRYTALNEDELIPVHVSGAIEGVLTVQNHPKDPSRGTKEVKTGPLVLIERTDAETLTEGQNATFINWGNLMIEAIKKENGVITAVNAKLNIDNKDYKNTVKLTWLAAKSPAKEVSAEELLNCYAVYFDHIISKPVLGKDDDFKDFVAKDTRKEVKLLGEFELKRVKKGEIIQLQRKGFFRCDVPYKSATSFSCREQPLILFHIPDGHVASTASSAAPPAVKKNAAVGGSSKKGLGEIIKSIELQGNKIRDLKSAKSDKSVIDPEVQKLLALKAEYKQIAGSDWKPGVKAPVSSSASKDLVTSHKKGTDQGDTVPALKTAKPDGDIVEENLKHLIAMKENYKEASRKEKKPNQAPQSTASSSSNNPDDLSRKIKEQADQIEEQIKLLSSLKSQFKSATGKEWSPTAPSAEPSSNKADELSRQIAEQGDKIRQLKSKKAEKGVIDDEVKTLLKLKNEYKTATGEDWKPPADTSKKTSKPSEKPKKDKPKVDKKQEKKEPSKTGTRLGLEAKKNENLPDWFSQVITKGEMIEYSDISGCYILRPWSFSVWEAIRDFFDGEIKKLGVENSAFPMFVSKAALEREKDHIADFAPEVAWVTKSGDSDLAEPIAIRPTSETVMYPFYAKWLKSHRDLPLKLNQWNSVVRWEFKHPQPFLRTREFLWQEGHSAFLTKPEADEEVLVILDLYAQIYEDLLAIPVVRGRKSDKEKFAGGDYTTTVEAYISASGRAIQGGTSHHLGQNFSKMFEILVEGAEEGSEKTYVYQNSWGITTRTIGVMVMVHGDDKGLVLPPRVAKVQAIIVPCGITAATSAEDRERLMVECKKLEAELVEGGEVKVRGDYRDNYSPGWKFNHWELKGVPVRIEVGFKDLEKGEVTLVRRDTSAKTTAKRTQAKNEIKQLLEEIHNNMFATAKSELQSHVKQTNDWNEFCKLLDQKNLLLSPFCGGISCEEQIKADSTRSDDEEPGAPSMGAKSLCIPFDQPKVSLESLKCIHPKCSERPKFFTLFGRSY
uniref:Bifunctional glutamate/proline--tRNA ligase n=1 Tax=Fopius arisanus TaxID=64838 RepID=A0A0C9RLA1_9HYME